MVISGNGDDTEWECDFDATFEFPFAKNTIVFTSFNIEADSVEFNYEHRSKDGEVLCTLHPALRLLDLKARLQVLGDTARSAAEQAILGLGMAVLCYVWMGFLTPSILVTAARHPLSEDQLAFWRTVLLEALREHFCVNGIRSFDGRGGLEDLKLISGGADGAGFFADCMIPTDTETDEARDSEDVVPRVLVPMGAGKDSTVAWEILTQAGCEKRWFFLEGESREYSRCWRYRALGAASGAPNVDDVLVAAFDWPTGAFTRASNQALSLAGHPWACIVCFAASVVALIHGYRHVAVGNERSAGLGNGIAWEGVEVNHQWDKSLAFERAAHTYLKHHCSGLINYFSVLTPLWDVQVGLLFGHLCSRYLPLILSCNRPIGAGATRWCAVCPKCAFVVVILGAFFPVNDVRAVFGDDLFETAAVAVQLDLLAGLGSDAALDDVDPVVLPAALPASARAHCHILSNPWKPFECVGGAEETRLALSLVERRYTREGLPLPRLFTEARRAALRAAAANDQKDLLSDWGEDVLIPPWLMTVLPACLEKALSAMEADPLLEVEV